MTTEIADTSTSSAKRSPTPSERAKHLAEDPDTAAARKELNNTAISDRAPKMGFKSRTPSPPGTDLAAQVASPKKKRARDEVDLDQNKDTTGQPGGNVSLVGADGSATGRTNRSEPEKKRHRDISSESKPHINSDEDEGNQTSSSINEKGVASEDGQTSKVEGSSALNGKSSDTTSTSAFKASGLACFANSTSPFLQGSKPLVSFASSSASPFATPGTSKTESPSIFGVSLTNGVSSFGQAGSVPKAFGGSMLSSGSSLTGFGGFGGKNLTSFGRPGETFKSSKSAKPFGAPESDVESDEAESGHDEEGSKEPDMKSPREGVTDEGEKKVKLQKVTVDDGEAGEVTILSARAKIYYLDKSSSPPSWRERGAGNLKINVPESCVDLDSDFQPIPGSFDASGLEQAEAGTVRLVMRQDSTHRLILNTAIIPAMTFQEKATTKAVCVLFTAIEGEGEAVSVQLKMSPVNAKGFLNEVGKVQRELQSN